MRKLIHWAIAYFAVGLSAGLAAYSGYRAADSPMDATLKALVMFVVAVLGCHGWAWAARMAKDGHKLWAVASWAILTVALWRDTAWRRRIVLQSRQHPHRRGRGR